VTESCKRVEKLQAEALQELPRGMLLTWLKAKVEGCTDAYEQALLAVLIGKPENSSFRHARIVMTRLAAFLRNLALNSMDSELIVAVEAAQQAKTPAELAAIRFDFVPSMTEKRALELAPKAVWYVLFRHASSVNLITTWSAALLRTSLESWGQAKSIACWTRKLQCRVCKGSTASFPTL